MHVSQLLSSFSDDSDILSLKVPTDQGTLELKRFCPVTLAQKKKYDIHAQISLLTFPFLVWRHQYNSFKQSYLYD
jgi:hypothetical protein